LAGFSVFLRIGSVGSFTGLEAVFSVDLDLLAAVSAFLHLYTQPKMEGLEENQNFFRKEKSLLWGGIISSGSLVGWLLWFFVFNWTPLLFLCFHWNGINNGHRIRKKEEVD
jgi:hypothetical protein